MPCRLARGGGRFGNRHDAFIDPPQRLPIILRLGIWLSTRAAGRELLLARLLAWYPRVAVSSGILEALIAHRDGRLGARILQLVRLQTSFAVACPFCIDMNAVNRALQAITPEELAALQAARSWSAVPSFLRNASGWRCAMRG
jgi:alkylhydroperoxidase family enzyme